MTLKKIIFVIAVFVAGQSHGYTIEDLEKGILKCAELDNRGDRITCYDYLGDKVKDKGIEPEISKAESIQLDKTELKEGHAVIGKWSIDIDRNKKDDSKTVIVGSIDPTSKDYLGRYRAVGIRCKEGEVSFIISWIDYLGNSYKVIHRIDSEKAVTSGWSNATSGDSSFYSKDTKRFLLSLIGKKTFYAETTAYRKGTVSLTIDLDGYNEAIKPVRKVCNF